MLDRCYVSFHSLCMRVWSPIQASWKLLRKIYCLLKSSCKRLDRSKLHANILSTVKLSSLIAAKDGSALMKFTSSYCKFIVNMKAVWNSANGRGWLNITSDSISVPLGIVRIELPFMLCLHHLKVALVPAPWVEANQHQVNIYIVLLSLKIKAIKQRASIP